MLCFNDTLSYEEINALAKALDFVMKKSARERKTTNFLPKKPIYIRYLGRSRMTETFSIYTFEELHTGEIFYIHISDCDTMYS